MLILLCVLGFSAFTLPMPTHMLEASTSPSSSSLAEEDAEAIREGDQLQITLVDCPGHASLIRTIIGGAQIIDMMLLVIDVNKGINI